MTLCVKEVPARTLATKILPAALRGHRNKGERQRKQGERRTRDSLDLRSRSCALVRKPSRKTRCSESRRCRSRTASSSGAPFDRSPAVRWGPSASSPTCPASPHLRALHRSAGHPPRSGYCKDFLSSHRSKDFLSSHRSKDFLSSHRSKDLL